MIVLDTNALIWWICNSKKLSKKAKKAIDESKKEESMYISTMSVLEILSLIKKNKLELNTLADNWLEKIQDLSYVHFVPIDNKVAVLSTNLTDFSHKDPADRIIIATALHLGAKLVTSDKKILSYSNVQTVW